MSSFIKKLLKKKDGENNEPVAETSRSRTENREAIRTTGFQPSSSFQDPANQRSSQLLPLLVKPPVPSTAEVRKRPQPVALPELVQPGPSKSGPGASRTDEKYPRRALGEASKEQIVLPKLPVPASKSKLTASPKTSASPIPKKKPPESGVPILSELPDENFRFLWDSKKLQKAKTVREALEMMDEREVLDTILAHLQQSPQRTPATDHKKTSRRLTAADIYAASQKAAAPQKGPKAPNQDKASLYKYYGMKLRDASRKDLVCEHLHILLRLTGKEEDREGISEAVGLVAFCHLPELLKTLREYGHFMVTRKSLQLEVMSEDEAIKRCFLKAVTLISKALQHCKKEDIHVPHKPELVFDSQPDVCKNDK
ncbi:uncharacterized protein LOC128344017 [Hemicordylus capensis]|uniref:uncharacterized protein LOC128344017 n=1 Tax=Hemicordylus capensis TaxID=884348 RepID=UPI0023046AE2|nr:uncharacterized protein LOC128344017 [Hemicordylus capensis]